MTSFPRNRLRATFAGLGAICAPALVDAVSVNPDGVGQVLLYPYYTVRNDPGGNPYNSLVTVVNTTATAKAARVRFLEGMNGRPVLDFNLFLSPFDVWTAALTPSAATGGTTLATADRSCTIPAMSAGSQDFSAIAYLNDGATTALDRTREGYLEVIEMATYFSISVTATNVTHVSGTPPGCHDHVNVATLNDAQVAADSLLPGGGLMGTVTLINVATGVEFSSRATALDDFNRTRSLYQPASGPGPTLADVAPPVSVVPLASANPADPPQGVMRSVWASPIDAVSAVLARASVLNEFVLDVGTASATDWVMTFPTKRFYTGVGSGASAGGLFQRNFNGAAGACDDVSMILYDREERTSDTPPNLFNPAQRLYQLCWTTSTWTFDTGVAGSTGVLGSALATLAPPNVSAGALGIFGPVQNGWVTLSSFPPTIQGSLHTLANSSTLIWAPGTAPSAASTRTYFGLPVIGFSAFTFNNGTLSAGGKNVLSSYGAGYAHRGIARQQ